MNARLALTVLFVQDGRDDVLEVSVTGDPAVQRRQDGAERSEAPETSGGEPGCLTADRPQPGCCTSGQAAGGSALTANKRTETVF